MRHNTLLQSGIKICEQLPCKQDPCDQEIVSKLRYDGFVNDHEQMNIQN